MTFPDFSLHITSSLSFRTFFCCFSGLLGASWRPPGITFPGPNGRRNYGTPPFLHVHVSKSLLASQLVPPEPLNDSKLPPILPKIRSKGPKLGAHRITFHSHSFFLFLNYLILLITYYLLSIKYLLTYSVLLTKYQVPTYKLPSTTD